MLDREVCVIYNKSLALNNNWYIPLFLCTSPNIYVVIILGIFNNYVFIIFQIVIINKIQHIKNIMLVIIKSVCTRIRKQLSCHFQCFFFNYYYKFCYISYFWLKANTIWTSECLYVCFIWLNLGMKKQEFNFSNI